MAVFIFRKLPNTYLFLRKTCDRSDPARGEHEDSTGAIECKHETLEAHKHEFDEFPLLFYEKL
jgi:hypothetical protein